MFVNGALQSPIVLRQPPSIWSLIFRHLLLDTTFLKLSHRQEVAVRRAVSETPRLQDVCMGLADTTQDIKVIQMLEGQTGCHMTSQISLSAFASIKLTL